jgi:hypothetical protein
LRCGKAIRNSANSVRASLLKTCRPDRRSAAGDIIVQAGIAGAGERAAPWFPNFFVVTDP